MHCLASKSRRKSEKEQKTPKRTIYSFWPNGVCRADIRPPPKNKTNTNTKKPQIEVFLIGNKMSQEVGGAMAVGLEAKIYLVQHLRGKKPEEKHVEMLSLVYKACWGWDYGPQQSRYLLNSSVSSYLPRIVTESGENCLLLFDCINTVSVIFARLDIFYRTPWINYRLRRRFG